MFEKNIVDHSERLNIPVLRVPDKVIIVRGLPIRKKTAFDFSASVDSIATYFDAKVETDSKTFGLKSRVFHEKKIHQWSYLSKFKDGGAVCGYLIWFVSIGKIVWASVDCIKDAMSREEKSITADTKGVVVRDDCDPIDLRAFTKRDREWIITNFQSKP